MDLHALLKDLRTQRTHLEAVILALERYARGSAKRRGRPPAWLKAATAAKRGRPVGSKNRPKEQAAGVAGSLK